MVLLFPEQAARPLTSPAIGAEEVFVHEREPAQELLLLHAPQAPPPLSQLCRRVPPPHRFLLRRSRGNERRLPYVGGGGSSSSRVLVISSAHRRCVLQRSHRRRQPRRRRLLPSLSLPEGFGGGLRGRHRALCSTSFHLLLPTRFASPCKRKGCRNCESRE
ncbi:unnamed protein product [Musa banksii]